MQEERPRDAKGNELVPGKFYTSSKRVLGYKEPYSRALASRDIDVLTNFMYIDTVCGSGYGGEEWFLRVLVGEEIIFIVGHPVASSIRQLS